MNLRAPLVLLAAAATAFTISACGDDDDDGVLDVDVNTTGVTVDTTEDDTVTTTAAP